jgi:small subunit ribosomal protein S21
MSKKAKQHKSIVPGNGLAVNVLGNTKEELNQALKTWKRKIKNAGVIETCQSRREFNKPSVINRAKLINAKFIQYIRDQREKL